MAKDGTNRGGARIGAGAKKKPLAERTWLRCSRLSGAFGALRHECCSLDSM